MWHGNRTLEIAQGDQDMGEVGVEFLRNFAQGVRGSALAPGGAGTLTASLRTSDVEMGSWDLMTPNTIFRASELACLGHARSR